MHFDSDVIIVGGGLAGLACGLRLSESGLNFLILDASDRIGGRVKTDLVEGFRYDRGFQVFLTAYPEARRILDYDELRLHPFFPGSMVRKNGKFYKLTDPWRKPLQSIRSLINPLLSWSDIRTMARVHRTLTSDPEESLFEGKEMTTRRALEEFGFSPEVINTFFRPFFGGVFLEPELETSSRMFAFVFRMMALGDVCLPEGGMEAIPRQMADRLKPESIKTGLSVSSVERNGVCLLSGESLKARAVVVATDGREASRLLEGGFGEVPFTRVTCIYFAAERAPYPEPMLVLNGDTTGLINNLVTLSNVSSSYSPPGAELISVTVLGTFADGDGLEESVRTQAVDWFGEQVRHWEYKRTYRIHRALPFHAPPALSPPQRPVRLEKGLYLCGDHRDNASINGALSSGRRAAEAVLEDL